ncbi:hypothetical protein, partial [Longispora fulva]
PKTDQRTKDQAAFLETFLNAQDKVLLSYLGQSVRDNSEIPSSSIIDDLTDYVTKQGGHLGEVKHKLHSFNPVYFDDEDEHKHFFTYQGSSDPIKRSDKTDKQPEKLKETLELQELINFMKDPFRHFYQRSLGIFYEENESLPEWECFHLDALQAWILKDKLRSEYLENDKFDLENYRT